MSIINEFVQECFDDIALVMKFVRSGSLYYRIVNDIFLCYGFQPLGGHFRLVVIISPLITGIGTYDNDRIVWFARGDTKLTDLNPGECYDVQIPEKRKLMKEYYREIILKIKPELESICDLQTAYNIINRVTGEKGPYRRFLVPPTKEAIMLYRLGEFKQAAEVKNIEYYPEIRSIITARDDEAISRLIESEFARSAEWLRKHRMYKNIVGGSINERERNTKRSERADPGEQRLHEPDDDLYLR